MTSNQKPAPASASPRPVVDPTPHRSGQTTPHVEGALSPRLPHERDESADSQSAAPDPVIQQGHADIERGLVDTDRGPVTDQIYENKVRPGGVPTRDRGRPANNDAGTPDEDTGAPARR